MAGGVEWEKAEDIRTYDQFTKDQVRNDSLDHLIAQIQRTLTSVRKVGSWGAWVAQ